MVKWRYHCLMIRDLAIADAKLNAEGEKGWELVSVVLIDANTARAFFKMPVPEDVPDVGMEDQALVGNTPYA